MKAYLLCGLLAIATSAMSNSSITEIQRQVTIGYTVGEKLLSSCIGLQEKNGSTPKSGTLRTSFKNSPISYANNHANCAISVEFSQQAHTALAGKQLQFTPTNIGGQMSAINPRCTTNIKGSDALRKNTTQNGTLLLLQGSVASDCMYR